MEQHLCSVGWTVSWQRWRLLEISINHPLILPQPSQRWTGNRINEESPNKHCRWRKLGWETNREASKSSNRNISSWIGREYKKIWSYIDLCENNLMEKFWDKRRNFGTEKIRKKICKRCHKTKYLSFKDLWDIIYQVCWILFGQFWLVSKFLLIILCKTCRV